MAKNGKRKGEKKSKARKAKSINKSQSPKKHPAKPKRIFIYALGTGVLAGSIYLAREYWKKRKAQIANSTSDSDTIIINNNLPVRQSGLPASYASSSKIAPTSGDSFPLKRGSRGLRVKQLQQALASILGEDVMKANGGIDGIFGAGTANALKLAGYPDAIDEATFTRITSKIVAQSVQVVFNPKELADKLYKFSQNKNLEGVLSILKQFYSTSDYTSVNEYYKKFGFISKTIVTDLLDYAFKSNEEARQEIKNEFLRIGLKMDAAGKWSLSGFRLFKDLITLRETIVIDSRNNRIPVQKNTVLGDEIKISNGMTWFQSVDKSILQVPTQDVTYT